MKFNTILLVCAIFCIPSYVHSQDELSDLDLTIKEEDNSKISGGFGAQLAKNSSFVNFNGYITNEFKKTENRPSTFDNHYFNLFISSQLSKNISAEGQLEYEHGGEEIQLRYGFADISIYGNKLIFRSGKFLTPAGEFNEYQYPEYLSKTVERAYVNREVSPSAWGEVGIQVRGELLHPTRKAWSGFYSIYVVNGLEGEEGSDLRSMRNNHRDKNFDNKAIGGNIGIKSNFLKASTNYYSGIYTPDGQHNLSVYGASLSFEKSNFVVWSEYQAAKQEISNGYLHKHGYYLLFGYKFFDKLEPIIRYDQIDLDQEKQRDRRRMTMGINYYIFRNAVFRVNYDIVTNVAEVQENNQFSIQFSVGF